MAISPINPKERPMYKALYSAYERLFVVDRQMREIVKFLEENKSVEAQELAIRLRLIETDFETQGDFLD